MNSKTAMRPCPVCGNSEVSVISEQSFVLPEGHPLPSEWDVVSCPKCHFAYADTPGDQQVYDRYYRDFSKYEHDATSTGGGANDADRMRLEDTAALIAKLAEPSDAILDLGCANGGLLMAFKKLGFVNLVGVDPSPACARATASIGVECSAGSLFEPPLGDRKFKVVILCHVLEHIRDLGPAASKLHGLVMDDGYLYVEVPDASRYGGYSEAPFQDFNVEHINHFSHASLSNLFEGRGFITVDQGFRDIPSSEGWIYPAIWSLFKMRSGHEVLDGGWRCDLGLKESLDQYTSQSMHKIARIDEKLTQLVESQTPVVVWGVGQFTLKLLAQSTLGRCKIIGFVDNNQGIHGKRLHGVKISGPELLLAQNCPVIIGSLLHHQAIEGLIKKQSHHTPPLITFT